MDEKLLEELMEEKTRGAKRDRLVSRIAAIALCGALLAGIGFGARFLTHRTDPGTAESSVQSGNREEDSVPPSEDKTQQQDASASPEGGTGQEDAASTSDDRPEQTDSAPSDGESGEEQQQVVHHELRVLWPEEGIIDELPQTIYFKVRHAEEDVVLLELNARKEWRVSWEDAYPVEELQLQGKYPEELRCLVSTAGQDFVIRMEPNTDYVPTGDGSGGLTAGTEETLPQTGMDWFTPAALLFSGAGLLRWGSRGKVSAREQGNGRQDVRCTAGRVE